MFFEKQDNNNCKFKINLQLFAEVDEGKEDDEANEDKEENESDPQNKKQFTEEQLNKLVSEHISDALKKFKAENKEAEKLAKMSASERDKAEFEIEKKNFEEEKKKYQKEKLELQVTKELAGKDLPIEFARYLIASDAETCMSNINSFEKLWGSAIKKAVDQKLKGATPKSGGGSLSPINPYAKESFSLTRQMELEITNPTLAKQLREQINNQ